MSVEEGLFWVSLLAAHGKNSSGSGWQTPLVSSLQQTQRETPCHPVNLLSAGHTTISHWAWWQRMGKNYFVAKAIISMGSIHSKLNSKHRKDIADSSSNNYKFQISEHNIHQI